MHKKRQRDAEVTKAAILQAAEELFADKGYAGTTLREISEQSGASGPLIIFHFEDKRGVYNAVKGEIIRRYIHSGSSNPPTDETFEAFIRHTLVFMFDFYRENPTMMKLANWGRLEGDNEPWPGEAEWHHVYRKRLQQAQQNGEIRADITPLNISIIICGAVHIWWEYHEHFIEHVMQEDDRTSNPDDSYLEQCLAFILHGLGVATRATSQKTTNKLTQI